MRHGERKSSCLICENNALTNEFPKVCFPPARSSLFGFVLIVRAHSGESKKKKKQTAEEAAGTEEDRVKKREVFVWKTPYLGCFWGDPNRAVSK